MKKIIRYQLSKKRFLLIIIDTLENLAIIKILNNEFDKDKKKERTYQKNTILLSQLEEDFHIEIVDESENILRIYETNE